MIEREKRWKLKGEIPKDKIKDKYTITQTYANFNPDVRIRNITDKNGKDTFFHTVKYNLDDGTREELEHRISKERYDRINKTLNDKKPVIKDRYLVELDNDLVAEIDCFLDTGDIIIEVEFPNENVQNSFAKPDWFGNELKNKQNFSIELFKKINNMNSIWD